MFDEHTLIFVASKIEISYKAKKYRQVAVLCGFYEFVNI